MKIHISFDSKNFQTVFSENTDLFLNFFLKKMFWWLWADFEIKEKKKLKHTIN